MRDRVAPTGGGSGSAGVGKAARRSARYSSTGSTTQPSPGGEGACARPLAVQNTIASKRQTALPAIVTVVRTAETVRLVKYFQNTAIGFDRGRHEGNMPTRFIFFLL